MHSIRKHIRLFAVVTAMLLSAGAALAQFSSSIEGSVTDSSGAVVPGATVVLTGTATGVASSTTTNGAGFYKFPSLGPGSYQVAVTVPGFAVETITGVTLTAEQTRGVPFTLKPKSETTSVQVTASDLTVDTDEAKIGSVITKELIEDLPLQGRDIFNVANQAPGVTGTGLMGTPAQNQDVFQDTTTPAVVANGAPNHSNTYLLDGISLDDSPSGGDAKLVPSPDALQEVTVTTNDYSAQFGKAASLVLQMTSKSGTDTWHGSLFEDYTSNGLTARTMYQTFANPAWGGGDIPPYTRNEFGGSAGGPIFKNKTFFFATWDQVISNTSNSGPAQFEDPAFTAWEQTNYPGSLSASLMKNDPVTLADPTPSQIQTVAQVQLIQGVFPAGQDCRTGNVGPLDMPCNMNLFDISNATTIFPHNGYQYHGRVDHNFPNSRDRIYASMFAGKATGAGDTNPRGAFETEGVQNQWYGALNYTHVFGPSLVNETGLGWSRISFGVPCNDCALLFTGINGIQNFGNGGSPIGFAQNDLHYRDMVSIVRGRHGLKVGFEMFHNQDQAPFTPNDNRNQGWGFDTPWDFASGKVDEYGTIDFNPVTGGVANGAHYFRNSTYGAYVQDDWKARRDLSINIGLRWDATSNPTEAHGNLNPLTFSTPKTYSDSTAELVNIISGIGVDVSPGTHHPFVDHKKTYFAPRFGFAWQPWWLHNTSVRGGAGIFFDRGGNTNWSDTEAGNPPGVGNFGASVHQGGPQPPSTFSLCASASFPYGCPLPAGLLTTLPPQNSRGGFGPWLNVGGPDPHLKMAYMENVFLGVQQAFRSHWIWELDGIRANSIHEYSITNMNRQDGEDSITWAGPQPNNPTNYGGFNAPNLSHSSFPNLYFNNINYASNREGSSYYGLTTFVRKSFSTGYAFQVAYTWEKTIDLASTVPGVQKGAEYSQIVDAYNVKEQKGLSSQNVPQQVSANGLWKIPTPFLHEGLTKTLVGGWELSGLSAWLEGFPTSIFTDRRQDDFNLDGQLYDFPNRPIAGIKTKGFSHKQFLTGTFNQNAANDPNGPSWPFTNFPLPVDQHGIPTGVEGNGGRNTVQGPGFVQVDGALTKNTSIPWFFHERGNLQIQGQFFNVFNHINLQGWDTDLGHGSVQDGAIVGTFGRTLGQGQARTVQLNANFRF